MTFLISEDAPISADLKEPKIGKALTAEFRGHGAGAIDIGPMRRGSEWPFSGLPAQLWALPLDWYGSSPRDQQKCGRAGPRGEK